MSNIVIKVEHLSKRYQLGTFGYGSLQSDLKAWWAKIRKKEDPNTKIGEKSRMDLHGEFWALKDIDLEIEQGDRVGIVGRNGAGKSTLLKLLSRVTGPTTGSIKVRGRIASLLEVGTGFHPELSGRENVFLNGAILGMKRREIQAKFDEIVEFAGIGQFIDTPVKRYSSGMYVRLAFSVAAHLDSDILIVDEVLAVGDAEFQRKCLGKIDSVSRGEGKTVLLVSHNLSSIRRLCNKGVFLKGGTVFFQGDGPNVFREYESDGSELGSLVDFSKFRPKIDINTVKMKKFELENTQTPGRYVGRKHENLTFQIVFDVLKPLKKVFFSLSVVTLDGTLLFNTPSDRVNEHFDLVPGIHRTWLSFMAAMLEGNYELHFGIVSNGEDQWWGEGLTRLEIVSDSVENGTRGLFDIPYRWSVE